MAYPATYRYTKDHEWIDVSDDMGRIGLTDHAQCQLGDIVFVEVPNPGVQLEAGKALGVVESVKTASDIYAPVSGEVIETNFGLKEAPEKINSDPHGEGWLVKVRLKDPSEINSLMDATAYEAYVSISDKDAS